MWIDNTVKVFKHICSKRNKYKLCLIGRGVISDHITSIDRKKLYYEALEESIRSKILNLLVRKSLSLIEIEL